MYNMELLNDIEKEILKTEKYIDEVILKDGNIITSKQLKEIQNLKYTTVLNEGVNKANGYKVYSINLNHKKCELDIESTLVYVK